MKKKRQRKLSTKRVIVIMDKDMHKTLKDAVKDTDWSVSGICRLAIKDYIATQKFTNS